MSKVAWDFLIHDFPPSFVKTKLQPIQTKYLKKWSGLARAADPSVLYRSRENAGLGMKESCEEHKRQRLIRRHQLATSEDPKVKAIHEEFADFQRQRKTNEWKETRELENLQAEAKIRQVMGRATDGAGIGFGYQLRGRPCDGPKAEREAMLRVFKEIYEEERLVKVMSKPLEDSDPDTHPDEKKGNYFCGWLKWKNAMMVDLRWDQLLRKQDSYLRFVLNATQESLPTPSRLKHWNKSSGGDGKCPLCSRFVGTLKHILCRCPHAINEEPQSRITWRHDSILLAWKKAIEHQVESTAGKPGKNPGCIQFQSAGLLEAEKSIKGDANDGKTSSQPLKVHHKDQSSKNVLRQASDWKIQFDLELDSLTSPKRAKAFPSEIAVVSGEGSCPDGVVWSMETKTVIMLELTSPWEENFGKWHKRKMRKYNQLVLDLEEGKHNGVKWNAQLLCVEIGARGALHEMAWGRMCGTFGITKGTRKALRDAMQDAAIQCSHFIFLCRYHKKWEPQALRDTWVPPKKGNSTSSKMASAETCGKSSESSEDVRSTQASSDKDSSSPLLIKTVFAVISEDMIR